MTDEVTLRPATDGDADLLLRWANDPLTRASGFHADLIEPAEHRAWLADRLARPDRPLLVAIHAGEPIGVIRLDPAGSGEVEVGIALAPEFRGRGLAGRVLSAGLAWAERDAALSPRSYVARIRPANARSLALFRRQGFVEAATVTVNGVPCLVLTRPAR